MGSLRFVPSLVLFVVLIFLLLSCSSGGGGGGDSFTPISYSGNSAQATLDGANVEEFAALVENGASLGEEVPLPLAVSAGTGDTSDIPVPVLQSIYELNKTLPDQIRDVSPTASIAAATQTETTYCGIGDGSDGSMTITATVESSGAATATVTFHDCDEGSGVVLNGAVSLRIHDIYADPYVTPVTINMTYKNLEMYFTDPGESVTIYAVMSMTEDLTGIYPVYSMNITDMIMRDDATGLTTRISNYHITSTDFGTYEEIVILSASVMARVYDHDLGYVEFYTVTPIKDDGFGPYEGVVRMEGANGSWAEIDFSVTCDAVTNNGSYFDGTDIGEFCYVPAL